MARPLKPLVKSGGYYPSNRWTPLVYPGGYTTANGGGQPEPEAVLKTVTGSLIHITDALAKPAQALSVKLEPIQDLHGYDSPWPAGGGVNLLDPAKCSAVDPSAAYGLTVTHDQATAIWTISGTPTSQSASLAFNFCTYSDFSLSGKGYQVQDFPISGTPIKNFYGFRNEAENKIAIIIDTVANPTVNMTFKVSVAATSQTAWSPYSNICPISGRTSATVTRTGKNLANFPSNTQLPLATAPYTVLDFGEDRTIQNCSLSFFADGATFTNSGGAICDFLKDDGTHQYRVSTAFGMRANESNTGTFSKTESNITFRKLNVFFGNNYAVWTAGKMSVQLELGSTASAYEPYAGNTYTIQLGDTVYGGTLDVTGGKMVVDRAIVDLGTLHFSLWNSTSARDCYSFTFTDIKPQSSIYENINALSTIFIATNYNASWKPWQMSYTNTSKQVTFIVPHGEYATPEDFAVAMSGVMFCYELATPIEITLTPAQIEMLLGENNLWADAGDSTLTYYADGNASTSEALGILLGGTYNNPGGADDVSDDEALGILLGGS